MGSSKRKNYQKLLLNDIIPKFKSAWILFHSSKVDKHEMIKASMSFCLFLWQYDFCVHNSCKYMTFRHYWATNIYVLKQLLTSVFKALQAYYSTWSVLYILKNFFSLSNIVCSSAWDNFIFNTTQLPSYR